MRPRPSPVRGRCRDFPALQGPEHEYLSIDCKIQSNLCTELGDGPTDPTIFLVGAQLMCLCFRRNIVYPFWGNEDLFREMKTD